MADLLDKAADVMEEDGWIRGNYQAPYGVCTVGALYVAEGWQQSTEFRAACAAVHEQINGAPLGRRAYDRPDLMLMSDIGAVTKWNDTSCRNAQQALDTLRAAAKATRE